MFCSSSDLELSVWAGRARFAPPPTPLLPALARPCVYFRMAVRRKEEFHATLQAHKVSPFLCAAAWRRSAGMPIQAADAAQRSHGTALHLPAGLPRRCFLPAFRHTGSPRPGLTRNSRFLCIPAWEKPRKKAISAWSGRNFKCRAPSHRGCSCVYCQR